MSVGIGLPDIIDEIKALPVQDKELPGFIRDMIRREIEATKSFIEMSVGAGIYEDHIRRWSHHIEAYQKVHEIVETAIKVAVSGKARKKTKKFV